MSFNDPEYSFDLDTDPFPPDFYEQFKNPNTSYPPPNKQLPPRDYRQTPTGCNGPPPSFDPPPAARCYTSFKTLDQAIAISNSLHNINGCYIAIPLNQISTIRNDKRRSSISGYIIHH